VIWLVGSFSDGALFRAFTRLVGDVTLDMAESETP
jgi:hypothetical protein